MASSYSRRHFGGVLVISQCEKSGMSQPTFGRPLDEPDPRHQF
jgi:hypothetical protein